MTAPIQKILVGFDFSEGAKLALRSAVQLGIQTGATLQVVYAHWLPDFPMPDPYVFYTATPEMVEKLSSERDRLRSELQDLVGLEVAGRAPVVVQLKEGEVRQTLLDLVHLLKPDLLVIGSHGRSAVMRLLLGSVSTYLVQHCSIPVLVVPTPDRSIATSAGATSRPA